MTVSTTTAEVVLPGDAVNFTFNLGFEVATADTLVVYLRDTTLKNRTLLVLNIDYTIDDLDLDAGATITHPIALTLPLVATAMASTDELEIRRLTPSIQSTTLITQGSFSPTVLDERVDILTKRLQEVEARVARSIRAPVSESPADLPSFDSPTGKALLFDANWNPTIGVLSSTTVVFSTFGESLVIVVDAAAGRTVLNVEIGVDVQAFTAALDDVTGINTGDEVAATTSAAGILEISSTAEYHSKAASRAIAPDVAYAAAAVVTLSDGANIAFDMDTGINFDITLAGNRTLDNPTNNDVGQSGFIEVNQDGTGTRTLAYGSKYVFPGGVAPVLTTTASHKDILFYTVLSATEILITLLSDFS
jgi:hypothetical protein